MSFGNQLDPRSILSAVDWLVFLLIFLLTFGAVWYGHRRRTRGEADSFVDYLLMGRALTLPLFVATLVATWYGGIFGVTQIAFESGIYNFVTQGVFWYATYLIFALFLVDRVRAHGAATLPEVVGRMFGPRSRRLSAVFNFFNVVPIAYAISVGILIRALFGIDLSSATLVGVGAVVLYSFAGGFRAVVFSDLVQFGVMCLSVALVVLFSVDTFGGAEFLSARLPEGHFSALGGHSPWEALVWGLIALSTLVDPNFYQRCLAATDSATARRGILVSTLIWMVFDICTTLGGMYARAVIPEASSGEAYLVYALQLLPNGLRGFFLAGVLATVLSTIDSYLHVAGATVSYDLVPRRFARFFGERRLYHLGVLAVGLLAALMAELFDGSIRAVWKTLGSYSAACLLFPVMWGFLFPGRISDRQFVGICLLGVAATTVWRNWNPGGFWADFDEIYAGVLATSSGILVLTFTRKLASRLTVSTG